jgi:hypothetical protein
VAANAIFIERGTNLRWVRRLFAGGNRVDLFLYYTELTSSCRKT